MFNDSSLLASPGGGASTPPTAMDLHGANSNGKSGANCSGNQTNNNYHYDHYDHHHHYNNNNNNNTATDNNNKSGRPT